jgi:hypothetical protein
MRRNRTMILQSDGQIDWVSGIVKGFSFRKCIRLNEGDKLDPWQIPTRACLGRLRTLQFFSHFSTVPGNSI